MAVSVGVAAAGLTTAFFVPDSNRGERARILTALFENFPLGIIATRLDIRLHHFSRSGYFIDSRAEGEHKCPEREKISNADAS